MSRRRAITFGILLSLAAAGLAAGRTLAREAAAPRAPPPCACRLLPNGSAGAEPALEFMVRATPECLARPGYEACLARIDAADRLTTVSLGVEDPAFGFSTSAIALIRGPRAEGMRSAVSEWLGAGHSGSTSPGTPSAPPSSSTPAPTQPKPVIPSSWKITILTGYSCWWGTCKYTCSNVVTCSTTITCYAPTCENHFTCKPGPTPQGCDKPAPEESQDAAPPGSAARGLRPLLR
ncbi:MAG: hypothetical protein HY812_06585 [Planctomycetes bacterium]|nr:hypothetical protein [Planctomycetota bacterium]